ncbi:bnr asp-box repeat domain protein [Diaporthe eres]|uniref:Glycoside hydrolase family 93 protein n=1 Tax=Diaporthe vaccinii TaxID=105482 RepID=A0ABR4E6P2_9PEZI|nr:bnr asp-box repeat domain protein [Diaporthe eres]
MASLKPIVFLSSLLSLAQASPLHHPRDEVTTFDNNVIFVPPSDYTDPRVLYARTTELTLNDNVLLATWENYSPEPPVVYFPIYKSVDHGVTWNYISNVTDDVNGWGLRYQPFIYELPVDFGGYKAGTVLVAGNSIPTDLSETKIDVYASTDAGYTWEFVSSVARGGEALPNNGLTPIWEPYIEIYEDQLVLYYSDQRDPDHGQKLIHQTTTDLLTWADPVDDVAYDEYTDRPGMTTIAQLPTGDYILTYEWGHNFSGSYSFPVTYRINANPLDFDSSEPVGIVAANTGTTPTGSPYVVWSSVGGENGTIVVSCGNLGSVFTNQALGAVDQWFERETPQPAAYTRHLRVFAEDPDKLLIAGAGKLPPSTTNEVSLSVVSIEGLLSS